jgi:DNA-binding CsgD family transcriptional regulator
LYIAEGKSVPEVAEILNLSEQSVRNYGHRFKCSFCEQRSVYTFR